jgi:hypothetical protein
MKALFLSALAAVGLLAGLPTPDLAAQQKAPPKDYKDLPLKKLGVELVKAKKDAKTGFVVGGKNATALIKGLKEINGRTIAQLEKDMRPGASSRAGFLGRDEKLLDVLAADNKYVVDELGLTHQELARHLHVLGAIGFWQVKRKEASKPFAYHGRRFKVEVTSTFGFQPSPFGDGTRSGSDATVTNLDNGKKVAFGLLVPYMIDRYGFYEGKGTSYRVDPRSVVAVLDFLKGKAKKRQGACISAPLLPFARGEPSKPGDPVRRGIDVRPLLRHQLGHQPARRRRQRQPQHAVPRRQEQVVAAGDEADERQAIGHHRPPAPPLFEERRPLGLDQVKAGGSPQQLQSGRRKALIEAGEFHRRADPVGRPHGRDGDAVLLEQERQARAERRPGGGDRVAFARLDGHVATEVPAQQRRPRPRRDDDVSTGQRHHPPTPHCEDAPPAPHELCQGAVLADLDAQLLQPGPPRSQQSIRPQVGVALVVVGARQARFEGRLQHGQFMALVAAGRHVELVAQQPIRVRVVVQCRRGAEDEEQAALLEFGIHLARLQQFVVELSRRAEQRLKRMACAQHIAAVAAEGEAHQPGPQRRIETRANDQG